MGGVMPEFTTVSAKEAELRTLSGRHGQFIPEQAGNLRIGESENPLTIRRRLVVAAQTLGIPLIIKRSGSELYFWRESREEEQPRSKRGYTHKKEVGR
jgi:hypothetical protein